MLLRHDDQRIDGDAHHDRRHAVEHVGGEADGIGQLAAAAKLRQVDAGADADGNADAAADRERTPDPKMALAMPPPARRPASGIWVKKARFSELAPL